MRNKKKLPLKINLVSPTLSRHSVWYNKSTRYNIFGEDPIHNADAVANSASDIEITQEESETQRWFHYNSQEFHAIVKSFHLSIKNLSGSQYLGAAHRASAASSTAFSATSFKYQRFI
ncbi:MAG: hypothetical protein RSF70_05405 [Ruthenibacterium sp.]